jgi:hypothetical protein
MYGYLIMYEDTIADDRRWVWSGGKTCHERFVVWLRWKMSIG